MWVQFGRSDAYGGQKDKDGSEIKVTNVEKRTEKSAITLALSSMKGIVGSCLDKVAKGPQGHRCEGHPGRGRTRVRDMGHRGCAGTGVKHAAVLGLFQMYVIEVSSPFGA